MIKQLTIADELKLRRFLLKIDPVYAQSAIIKDYFLAGSDGFGVMASIDDAGNFQTIACFSVMVEKSKSFIHYWIGDVAMLNPIREKIGYPCQAFLQDGVVPPEGWREELKVTPGYVVDHPAYSGVFTRTAPRFAGAVYEHD